MGDAFFYGRAAAEHPSTNMHTDRTLMHQQSFAASLQALLILFGNHAQSREGHTLSGWIFPPSPGSRWTFPSIPARVHALPETSR